ncbi:hypothetical protein Desde_1565 [Desulfitobacterium dehalogenans ATCC 51507]|uniref:Uncharacterized protein n=1 Tax=Desulfitobacterium dehalogenans (strain ATCC 51507 / DSM 9161 / JW/IU-DC1) TaxID=756499 RepID=I4A7N6_DESDJ|nr:hypothetical protein [Desulfitobacterium dehalogenans]AFL99970.1 hypothetical protein Desde_1565 [Desulfitobacterium dehalogenans ATCC 51507]
MFIATIMLFISGILSIAIVVGIFFAIKYFIKYNADLKRGKTQQQEELDRMKIDDL